MGWHAGGINRFVRRKAAYMADLGMTKCHVLHDTAGKVMIMDGWVWGWFGNMDGGADSTGECDRFCTRSHPAVSECKIDAHQIFAIFHN